MKDTNLIRFHTPERQHCIGRVESQFDWFEIHKTSQQQKQDYETILQDATRSELNVSKVHEWINALDGALMIWGCGQHMLAGAQAKWYHREHKLAFTHQSETKNETKKTDNRYMSCVCTEKWTTFAIFGSKSEEKKNPLPFSVPIYGNNKIYWNHNSWGRFYILQPISFSFTATKFQEIT